MSNQICVEYPEGFTFTELVRRLRAKEVMRYGVTSVNCKEPIHKAVSLMIQMNISCIPVTRDGVIAGVLSDKDLLHSYYQEDYLPDFVEKYMTETSVSYQVEDYVSDICQCLTESAFRQIPVLIGDILAGMITRTDLISMFLKHARAVSSVYDSVQLSGSLMVEDAMKCGLITLSPEDTIADAMDAIAKHDVTGVPVVAPTMELVGMITAKDILSDISQIDVMTTKIEDRMVREVTAFSPKSDLGRVCRCLLDYDFHQIPIVLRNRLVGIITRSDILRARARTFKLQTS
jgi:CBS domain-containing protein